MKTLYHEDIDEKEVLLNYDGERFWLSINGKEQSPVVETVYRNNPRLWIGMVLLAIIFIGTILYV